MQTRTIQNGCSAQFPVTGRFTAKYHTPGDMIVGQGTWHRTRSSALMTISLPTPACTRWTKPRLTTTFVDLLNRVGSSFAREHDKRLARTITLGARTSTADLTANLPSGLSPDDPYRTGTGLTSTSTFTVDDLVASVFVAAEALDSKDVSKEGRVLVAPPSPSIR